MEIPLFRLRICILLVILLNIANELNTLWVSRAHMILAPAVLVAFAVITAGQLVGATCGRNMPRVMIVFFDLLALATFASLACVVVNAMDMRTLWDPIVMDAIMPVVTFHLFLADLLATFVFCQHELELKRLETEAQYGKN